MPDAILLMFNFSLLTDLRSRGMVEKSRVRSLTPSCPLEFEPMAYKSLDERPSLPGFERRRVWESPQDTCSIKMSKERDLGRVTTVGL